MDKKLSAYERRKINSQKIAQVQFEPKHHPSSEENSKHYEYIKKKHEQFARETEKVWREKPKKEVWTSIDQRLEEELWDE